MLIPDELKLNRFRLVKLPSVRDLYARYGQRNLPATAYTGDEDAVFASTKVEALARSNAELAEALANEPDNQE